MRRWISALVLVVASIAVSPAHAGGLLQNLFAPTPRAAPAVMYYAPPQPHIRFLYDEGLRVSRRHAAPHKAIAQKHQRAKRAVAHRKPTMRVALAPGGRTPWRQANRPNRAHLIKASLATAVVAPAAKIEPAVVKNEAPVQIDNDPTLRVGDAYMTPEGLRIYRGPQARAKERKVFVDFRGSTLGAGVKSQLAALEGAARNERAQRNAQPALKVFLGHSTARKSVDRQGREIRVVGP